MSSAYYAAFHQVSGLVAGTLFPSSESFQLQARRSVSHVAVYTVSSWLTGQAAPQHLQPIVDELRQDATVTSVAGSLIGLRDAREEADYDHTRTLTKRETLALVDDARQTVAQLKAAQGPLADAMALIALKTTPR